MSEKRMTHRSTCSFGSSTSQDQLLSASVSVSTSGEVQAKLVNYPSNPITWMSAGHVSWAAEGPGYLNAQDDVKGAMFFNTNRRGQ